MMLFYIHAGVMLTGMVLIATGAVVAGLMRQKRWWLKAHKAAVTAGIVLLLSGTAAAILMVEQSGGRHIAVLHAGIGLVTILLSLAASILGHLQFRVIGRGRHFREKHRWTGRITLVAGALSVLTGLRVADLI